MKGQFIEYLHWPEVENLLNENTILLVPVGARTKQHGHHLPINTDWLTAEYLARRITETCPVLTLPALPYGYYPAFSEYPGSVSLDRQTFGDSVEQIVRSFTPFGPTRFYLLNTGISTNWALEPLRVKLAAEDIHVLYTDPGTALETVEQEIRQQPLGTHADEIETSMMLYMYPDRVDMQRAVAELNPRRGPGPFSRDPSAEYGVYSPSGAWGDPTLATAEKGRVLTEALIEHITQAIEQLASADFSPAPAVEKYL